MQWSHHPELNRGPLLYESTALPTELWWQKLNKKPKFDFFFKNDNKLTQFFYKNQNLIKLCQY